MNLPFASLYYAIKLYDNNSLICISSFSLQNDGDDGVNLDDIATKLLNDRLYLTALELHMELLESGREHAKLRDFFSNPANFERTGTLRSNTNPVLDESSPPRMIRTASIQTFDSLDFARSSDDGERNENDRIAVLEFELRKTHETIRSLRAALTRTAATEISNDAEPTTPHSTKNLPCIDEPARPHERRALNFLVNEYLLRHDFKLTSVTFSEENANQDFDDWDDVGINIAKPPGLVHIYRDYGQMQGLSNQNTTVESCDFSCMTGVSCLEMSELGVVQHELQDRITVLDKYVHNLETENAKLVSTISHLENSAEQEHRDLDRLRRLQSTPTASPIRGSFAGDKLQATDKIQAEDSGEVDVDETVDTLYQTAVTEVLPTSSLSISENDCVDSSEKSDVLESQPSTLSSSSTLQLEPSQTGNYGRKTPPAFQQALLQAVHNVLTDNRIYMEVSHIAEMNEGAYTDVVPLLARCLPHIVPNVLLSGRDELIPLIVCSAALHSDSKTRDQLLNILFNLIKRPDVDQRRMILVGCVAFARHAGTERVESELLPQCWEQITHKFIERRLLVAEACGALTQHVSAELRGSLIFSMLQMMLEDSNDDVREAAMRSFGVLVGFIVDADKYQHVESLLFSALGDVSDRVSMAVRQVFLPSLAMWSMELGCLESGLITAVVSRIQKLVGSSDSITGVVISDQRQFSLLVTTLSMLLPVLFASFLLSAPFAATAMASDVDLNASELNAVKHSVVNAASDLLDSGMVVGGDEILTKLVCAFDAYIGEEWCHPWNTYTWVTHELVSQLKSVAESLSASDQAVVHVLVTFFRSVCRTFGSRFTEVIIRPQFQKAIQFPSVENTAELSSIEAASLVRCISPVYGAGVLAAFSHDEYRTELSHFLHEFIQATAIHKRSLVAVNAVIAELCSVDEQISGLPESLLTVLWDCIMHPSPLVRTTAALCFEPAVRAGGVDEAQVGARVVPALVTLAGDAVPDVRAATVSAFGAVVECISNRAILDKVYMQLQSFMDDPAYRDEVALCTALIRALGRAGPTAEPRFRDDFILPRLMTLAVKNSSLTSDAFSRKTETAMALFDAYCAVSCCFFSDQLVSEILLPGLKCLHRDLVQLSPDHVGVVASMIREFEDRADSAGSGQVTPLKLANAAASNGNSTTATAVSSAPPTGGDTIKSKMMSHIKDVQDRASHSNLTLSKIFTAGKK